MVLVMSAGHVAGCSLFDFPSSSSSLLSASDVGAAGVVLNEGGGSWIPLSS
jgi:hypothetical protein